MGKATDAKTFVLVHGTNYGGWVWRRVADKLQALGHRVYRPTLTGLAERSHLMSASLTVDTHIEDVTNLVRWEQLDDIVLCGHSSGGVIISGVVERIPNIVSSIVFLDAYMPEDGQKGLDWISPESRAAVLEAAARGETSRPPSTAARYNTNAADCAWVDAQATAQPIGVSLTPITLTGARDRVKKKSFIRARGYPQDTFERNYQRTKGDPSWRTYEVASGHNVMLDMPDRLVEILTEVA